MGRCWPAGVELEGAGGVGDELCEELFRLEPTRFLKRVFMEFMRLGGGRGQRGAGGVRSRISASAAAAAAADSELGTAQNSPRLCEGSPASLQGYWPLRPHASGLTARLPLGLISLLR